MALAGSPNASVYIRLGNTRTPTKKGSPAAGFSVDGRVLLETNPNVPLQSPYEFFYPEANSNLSPIKDRSKSPDVIERAELRKRRKEFFKEKKESFKKFESGSNLITVHKTFMQKVTDEGTVSKADFHIALQSLNVTDTELIERVFELFDAQKEGVVEYEEVIAAIDVIVNGTNSHITASDCFALVDPTGCGYIIMNWLQELKHKRIESPDVTHMMVKTLLEIFERLQAQEYERIVKERTKKGKKAKAEAAGPITYSKKIHLNEEEFRNFLATEPLLVQAFLSRILRTMETVYFKIKKAVALGAGDEETAA